MVNVEIEPMQQKDIDSVVNISILSFPSPWSKESFENELTNNKYARYLVAHKDGVVVGYGGMWIILDESHVTNIAVHPEYRGIGIGKAILDAMINVCKTNSIPSITLEVRVSNKIAQNMYEEFGFKNEGIRKKYYHDTGEDGIIMWKRDILKKVAK